MFILMFVAFWRNKVEYNIANITIAYFRLMNNIRRGTEQVKHYHAQINLADSRPKVIIF